MPFAIPFWLKIVGPLVLLAAVIGGIMAYGNSRYNAGVTDTDAKWEEASDRLKAQAAESATRADDAAAVRLEEFKQQVEDEEKALEEAERTGSSPLDVLFGG